MNLEGNWRKMILTLLVASASVMVMSTIGEAAMPKAVTVPWRGALDLPHETYNGKQIHLKGVGHNIEAGATATWNPGDGTPAKNVTPNPVAGFDFDLGVTHTYPASSAGTPYTATLTICNPGGQCASDTYKVVVRDRTLDTEINIAIDQGLWYAHRIQDRTGSVTDGRWISQGDTSPTASSIQAFQINNHFETGSPDLDPYADTVKRGLRYLFTRLGTTVIGAQTYGNPDGNGNGYGVNVPNSGDPPYELGMVMDAIVSTKTPAATVATGQAPAGANPGILGRTYKDIVQDMVDMYAWGQGDAASGYYAGGWRYSWNSGADNSACQWAAIGILAARDLFGCTVPQFVIDRNLVWLDYSRYVSGGVLQGYGYTSAGVGPALSPSGLVQAIMDNIAKTDTAYWVGAEKNMADNWNGWYRDTYDYYRLFALAKAMRLALPSPIVLMAQGTPSQIDWFKADCANPDACSSLTDKWGVARTILRDQNTDGFFSASYWVSGALNHAWGIIILTGTLQLEPVAVAAANPNPGAAGVPIHFDGSGSYHTDPAKGIATYQWFFSDGGSATGKTADHPFACAVLPCTYTATLQVTDNGMPPLVDTDTISVQITAPPHPPTANPNGPYIACVNEQLFLDGSKSFDIDTAQFGDSITAYGWELDFAQPLDFDEAVGVKPVTSFATAGNKDIGLKVWDDSKIKFGTASNLSHESFTTADVWDCSCIGQLTARPKPGKVDLYWAPVAGAAKYDIYRSTAGPNTGFSIIKADHVTTYATYVDSGLTNGTTYWYRVIPKNAAGGKLCGGSAAAGAKPMLR